MSRARIELPMEPIAAFCHRWQIVELALFGSVLRDDFRPDSDIDVLVSFAPDARWGWGDLEQMEQELSRLLGRDIDLVERPTVEQSRNYIRRQSILSTAERIYAAG